MLLNQQMYSFGSENCKGIVEKWKCWRVYYRQSNKTSVKEVWSRILGWWGTKANTKEKGDTSVDVFQDVHNPNLLGEESLKLRKEVLQINKWKLTSREGLACSLDLYFSFTEWK